MTKLYRKNSQLGGEFTKDTIPDGSDGTLELNPGELKDLQILEVLGFDETTHAPILQKVTFETLYNLYNSLGNSFTSNISVPYSGVPFDITDKTPVVSVGDEVAIGDSLTDDDSVISTVAGKVTLVSSKMIFVGGTTIGFETSTWEEDGDNFVIKYYNPQGIFNTETVAKSDYIFSLMGSITISEDTFFENFQKSKYNYAFTFEKQGVILTSFYDVNIKSETAVIPKLDPIAVTDSTNPVTTTGDLAVYNAEHDAYEKTEHLVIPKITTDNLEVKQVAQFDSVVKDSDETAGSADAVLSNSTDLTNGSTRVKWKKGNNRQIAREKVIGQRLGSDVVSLEFESPVDSTSSTIEMDLNDVPNDALITKNTLANYNGTVEKDNPDYDSSDPDSEERITEYPITETGDNTVVHGDATVEKDLHVQGDFEVDGLVVAHDITAAGALHASEAVIQNDVAIHGDLYVAGTTTTTNEKEVETSGKYIVTRNNADSVLTGNERSGLVVNNYAKETTGEFTVETGSDFSSSTFEQVFRAWASEGYGTYDDSLWQSKKFTLNSNYNVDLEDDRAVTSIEIRNEADVSAGTEYWKLYIDDVFVKNVSENMGDISFSSMMYSVNETTSTSKSAAITVGKDGTFRVSADTTFNNTTYRNISQYDGKIYDGLTGTEKTNVKIDIPTEVNGGELDNVVLYNGSFYHYTGADWKGPLEWSNGILDGPVVTDIVSDLEALTKHPLVYFETVTSKSVNIGAEQPLMTRKEDANMQDKHVLVWDGCNATSCTTDLRENGNDEYVTGRTITVGCTCDGKVRESSIGQGTVSLCSSNSRGDVSTAYMYTDGGNSYLMAIADCVATLCLCGGSCACIQTCGKNYDLSRNLNCKSPSNILVKNTSYLGTYSCVGVIPEQVILERCTFGYSQNQCVDYKCFFKCAVFDKKLPEGKWVGLVSNAQNFYITGLCLGTVGMFNSSVPLVIETEQPQYQKPDQWEYFSWKIHYFGRSQHVTLSTGACGSDPDCWTWGQCLDKADAEVTAIATSNLGGVVTASSNTCLCRSYCIMLGSPACNMTALVTCSTTNISKLNATYGVAIGFAPIALGFGVVSIGDASKAEGDGNIAIGCGAGVMPVCVYDTSYNTCKPIHSIAIGTQACSFKTRGIAIGYEAKVGGAAPLNCCHGICGQYGIAIGAFAQVCNNNSIAIGCATFARGFGSISLGNGSNAAGCQSIAIGHGTCACDLAVSIGTCSTFAADGAIAINAGCVCASAGTAGSILLNTNRGGSSGITYNSLYISSDGFYACKNFNGKYDSGCGYCGTMCVFPRIYPSLSGPNSYFRTGRVLCATGASKIECAVFVPLTCTSNGSLCTFYWQGCCSYDRWNFFVARAQCCNPLNILHGKRTTAMITGACIMSRHSGPASDWSLINSISYPNFTCGYDQVDFNTGWGLGWDSCGCFAIIISNGHVLDNCSQSQLYVSWIIA